MRYTKNMGENNYSFSNIDIDAIIKKLAKYEDMYDYILQDTKEIVEKMEALKASGDNKSCRFKELMVRKMTNNNIISALKIHGVEDI